MEHSQIFISYRRSDGAELAYLLKYFLERFGYSVYMDMNLQSHKSFWPQLQEQIRNCKDYIYILTPDSSRIKKNKGVDYMFEEAKCAIEATASEQPPRIHIVSKGNSKLIEEMKKGNVPPEYTETVSYLTSITLLDKCLDFSEPEEIIRVRLTGEYLQLQAVPHCPSVQIPGAESFPENGEPPVKSNYDADKEIERIRLEYEYWILGKKKKDQLRALRQAVTEKSGRGRFYVLDVGSSDGRQSRSLFKGKEYDTVVGTEEKNSLVARAQKDNPDPQKYIYRVVDLTDPLLDETLCRIERELQIPGFDLILCQHVLHLILDTDLRKKVISVLVSHLLPHGCFAVVAADDGGKLSYSPAEGDFIQDVLDMTLELKSIADRHYGRKLYSDLLDAELENVWVVPQYLCSSAVSPDNRLRFMDSVYHSSFEWRGEIFEDEIRATGGDRELETQLHEKTKRMKTELKKLRDQLRYGWYFEVEFFGYGFKRVMDYIE